MSRRKRKPELRDPANLRAIAIVCTNQGNHPVRVFGTVTASRVDAGWLSDLYDSTAAWTRDSLAKVQGFSGIPVELLVAGLHGAMTAPRVVDGWAIAPVDVVRAWPHFTVDVEHASAEGDPGESRITLQPFRCSRCKRSVPLKLETLEQLCAEIAASGAAQLDISHIGVS